jgi:hypothetical protein
VRVGRGVVPWVVLWEFEEYGTPLDVPERVEHPVEGRPRCS